MLPSSSNRPPYNLGSTDMQENPIRDDDIRGLIIDAFAHDVQNLRDSSNTDEVARIEGSTHQENINVKNYIQPFADQSA